MEPCSLVKRFGKDVTFWGGLCNSQATLPFGSAVEVKKETKHNVECFKSGNGGYIAANVHNITAEVPAANIAAMFEAAFENGKY
jgi:uroporphyrinogen decarboxylase